MKNVLKEFANALELAAVVTFFYLVGGVFVVSKFEPYVGSVVFFLIYAFLCIMMLKNEYLVVICPAALGTALFAFAKWVHMDKLEYSNKYCGDGSVPEPALPCIYWGWEIQMIIIVVVSMIIWKKRKSLAKWGEDLTKWVVELKEE